ncbi:MAG: restriction endonuclease subunit S [Rikenellaceae bacterium]
MNKLLIPSPHKSYYEKRGSETVCIDDEIPFEIPASWEWCRFSSIVELISGRDLTPSEYSDELGTAPYLIGASNIVNGQIDIVRWTNSPKVISKKGDILISVKGTIGEIVVNNIGDIHIARQFMAIREYAPIESEYYKIFLHSAIEYIKNAAKGIIPGISREDLLELLIPVPSYLEQRRIVASVNNAYKYIDIIKSNKSDLSAYIKRAKAKVLDLAIRGKLVSQDPTDEPASVLLERIKAEKEVVAKPAKRGAKTTSTTSDNSHYPNDIQEGWIWCNLNDICIINPKNNISDDTDCSFIPMPMIADGFKNKHTFEIRKWSEIKKGFSHFRDNDLAIAKITPCFENRKSVVLKNLEGGAGAGTTEIFILRPVLYSSMSEYLLLLAKTNQFISGGIANFNGAVGQQRVTREYIETYNISLPPLNKQKRIVAKVDEIFEQLDNIEKALME